MRKKIAWITADYFIDVDLPIVPLLMDDYEIEWYVLQGNDGKITIPQAAHNCAMHICKMPYRRRNPRCIGFYADIARRIKAFSPDIIYIDAMEMPYMYPVLDFYLPRRKMVHAAHNVVSYPGWPNRRMMQLYLKYVFAFHRNMHIFSQHTRRQFEAMYGGKNILTTPLSLKDYGKPSPEAQLPTDKVQLLFFGNVKQNKRLDILLKAYARLSDDLRARSHLSVLGSCEDKHLYEDDIKHLGNSVTFNPQRIPDEDIPNIFATHHYLVLPYENVAQSGPHMVAYNYGMPVIATDIEGFSEHVTDGVDGYLFAVNDVDALAHLLERVIKNKDVEYDALRDNLHRTIKARYAQDVLLSEYQRFFETI